MKRNDFIRYLEKNGCFFYREGKKHTVFMNEKTKIPTAIPRHNELVNFTIKKICKDLTIPPPDKY